MICKVFYDFTGEFELTDQMTTNNYYFYLPPLSNGKEARDTWLDFFNAIDRQINDETYGEAYIYVEVADLKDANWIVKWAPEFEWNFICYKNKGDTCDLPWSRDWATYQIYCNDTGEHTIVEDDGTVTTYPA